MDTIVWMDAPQEKAAVAESILTRMPDWFGLPESTRRYIEDSRALPFAACMKDGKAAGFAVLRETSPYAAELYVMGVLPEYHRQGIGTALFRAVKAHAQAQGYEFLQVKTVQSGHYEVYDRTNRFYQRMGFRELEVLPLWDEWNPCQVYVMALSTPGQSDRP